MTASRIRLGSTLLTSLLAFNCCLAFGEDGSPTNPLRGGVTPAAPRAMLPPRKSVPARSEPAEAAAPLRAPAGQVQVKRTVAFASAVEEIPGPRLLSSGVRTSARPVRPTSSKTVLIQDEPPAGDLPPETMPPETMPPETMPPETMPPGAPLRRLIDDESSAMPEEIFGDEFGGEFEMGGELFDPHGFPFEGDVCEPGWCGYDWQSLEVYIGAIGFTGPVNRGGSGSFGFQEGVNWGTPLPFLGPTVSGQVGFQAAQSNLSEAEDAREARKQMFITAGLFRRVDCGLQGGLVVDYLNEEWYLKYNLSQLRGELSWVFPCEHELGAWFTTALNSGESDSDLGRQNQVLVHETWQSTDLYAFFYRHRFGECGSSEARVSAGFSGVSDGLLAADLNLPLRENVGIQTGFLYLIPHEADGAGNEAGGTQESWNLFLNLVWYPGCSSATHRSYHRPLLSVANNGNFLVDRGE